MRKFGIIGYPLGHSFSANLFNAKFSKEHIDAQYDLIPLKDIKDCLNVFETKDLVGLNVTIPYKQSVIPYLNELSDEAQAIGAVNVVHITTRNGKRWLTGYNTDVIGFRESIRPLLKPCHTKAIVFGTGGASKAVAYGLKQLGLEVLLVSRTKSDNTLTYNELNAEIIKQHTVLVNATPLGMYPNINNCVDIDYSAITTHHLLYDVVYNPEKTLFLQYGEKAGAIIKNGLSMLEGQAYAAWQIWNQHEN